MTRRVLSGRLTITTKQRLRLSVVIFYHTFYDIIKAVPRLFARIELLPSILVNFNCHSFVHILLKSGSFR